MISIIGAGPAGNHLAFLLAKKGHTVNVYEEHKEIGNPVQCTGLVTDSIKDLVEIKEDFVVNKIRGFKVFSNNNSVEINFKKPNLVLDRMKFDKALAQKAVDSGANYFLGNRFEGCQLNKDYVEFIINHAQTAKGPSLDLGSKVFECHEMIGNGQYAYSDYQFENSFQTGEDVDIDTIDNRDYEFIDRKWFFNTAFGTDGGRFIDTWLKLKLIKDNKLSGSLITSKNVVTKIVSLITNYTPVQ
ncbi:MAG: NAD(P)/FAD-dependent oxidoreductase [Nanoarchaeota archaeon]